MNNYKIFEDALDDYIKIVGIFNNKMRESLETESEEEQERLLSEIDILKEKLDTILQEMQEYNPDMESNQTYQMISNNSKKCQDTA